MVDLAELAGRLETGTVAVGGRTVPVRALAGWEQALILGALPRPEPPQGPGGTPMIDDAGYAARHEWWYFRYRVAYAGIAADQRSGGRAWADVRGGPGGGADPAAVRAFVEHLVATLAGLDVAGVVAPIYERSRALGSPAAAMEAAQGNS